MILWLLLLIVVAWFVHFRIRRRRLYELASLIPAPNGELPLLGLVHSLSGNTESIMNKLKEYSYFAMQHNGLARLWLGPKLYFVLTNPADLEMVLKSCLEKDDSHRFIRTATGNASIFAPVSVWRKRRKFTLPVFNPKNLENFIGIFSEKSEKMARYLKSKANGENFSVWSSLTCYTLDSICESTLGISLNAQDDQNSPFLFSINRVMCIICKRIFHVWRQPDWIFKLLPDYQEHKKCNHTIWRFVDKVIEQKREEIKLENNQKNVAGIEFDLDNYTRRSFLDLLISVSGGETGFTNIELREEVMTFMIAGIDTSAVAIGNVLKVLAKYPEVQDNLYKEVYKVFGNSGRVLVKEDLAELKYMERVIKETLRLYPPVPFLIRKVLKELTLPSEGVLPAGSGVSCSIIGTHRDPKYWGSTSEQFDPDRFLPENFNLDHPCSFIPFSNGPRNCIGYQYALMSIKIALVAILCCFEVVQVRDPSPNLNFRFKIEIMMKAVDGYEIALKRRDVDMTT